MGFGVPAFFNLHTYLTFTTHNFVWSREDCALVAPPGRTGFFANKLVENEAVFLGKILRDTRQAFSPAAQTPLPW